MSSRLDQVSDWAERAKRARFNLSALAADCHVSKQHLRRYIESRFGPPPHLWMMRQRLQEAPKLLEQGLQVKEVANKLHFNSAEHFSRTFKKQYHVSPRSFRGPTAEN